MVQDLFQVSRPRYATSQQGLILKKSCQNLHPPGDESRHTCVWYLTVSVRSFTFSSVLLGLGARPLI